VASTGLLGALLFYLSSRHLAGDFARRDTE
jgi:hypothetical protein